MPNCSDCKHSDYCYGKHKFHLTRMRICTCALLNDFILRIKGKFTEEQMGRVLEIGMGATKDVQKMVNNTGTLEWYGVDPTWSDHPDRNIFGDSVGAMRFPDKFFDVVIASNSMEHWKDFENDYDKCLAEIRRVLKEGGIAYVLVPMCSHGARMFKMGRESKVERLFTGWRMSSFTSWKNDLKPDDEEYMFEIEVTR